MFFYFFFFKLWGAKTILNFFGIFYWTDQYRTLYIFSKMDQLEIFREDERRVTSLTLSRSFASKVATRRKQADDPCIDIGC